MAKETPKVQTDVNKKNIYITFIIAGVIAWFPLSSLMLNLFNLLSQWVPNPKVLGIIEVSNLVAAAVCAGAVYLMVKSEGVYQFTNEVFTELGKVSWPVKKGTGVSTWEKFRELRESTLVVLVSIVLLSVVVGVLDTVYQLIMKAIF